MASAEEEVVQVLCSSRSQVHEVEDRQQVFAGAKESE